MTARPPRGGIHHVSTDSYTHSGWSIVSSRAPIIGDQQITEYCEVLGKVLTLPEILFGNNKLVLRHNKSGYELSFSALHALQGWKAEDLAPLKVQVASEWQAARQQEIAAQSAIILQYDWTYTTPYQGTLGHATSPSPPAAAAAAADAGTGTASTTRLDFALGNADLQRVMPATARPPAAAEGAENRHPNSCPAPPPTTCTPATPAAAAAPGGGALPTWQPTSRQIDRGMLMCTDEPILFYAEVPLYESELDDNGACSCVVKVRLMRRCWLVLLRFFLRVDGSLVRLREARLFCRLDEPDVVVRETKHCEATLEELAAAGGSGSSTAYPDADAAAAVFSAIAPAAVKLYRLEALSLG